MTEFNPYGFNNAPDFILCNPNKEELFYLGQISERKYSPRFNAPSEISFRADQYIDGVEVDYYDLLTYKRLIYLKDISYFMITSVIEHGDGIEKYKEINGQSLEVEFAQRKLSLFKPINEEGIPQPLKLWSTIATEPNLIGEILNYMPGWTVGTVDIDPEDWRFFDVTDSTIYNFLVDEASKAYERIFTFDTINKTISARETSNITQETNIFLSYNNLIETIKKEEITDELVTSLTVLGAGGLDIRRVNPIGTNNIYKFDYFTALNLDGSSPWMDITLRNKIISWENLVTSYITPYKNLVADLSLLQDELATIQSEINSISGSLAATEVTLQGLIEAGEGNEPTTVDYDSAVALLASLELALDAKEVQEDVKYVQIEQKITELNSINTILSFSENFTEGEIQQLQPFIVESSYINDNYVLLDSMNGSTIQAEQQLLLDRANGILEELSQPRYTFEVNSINFTEIEEFAIFENELELGHIITIEADEGLWVRAILLGIDYDLEDPSNFKLIFGNRMRLDNSSFKFSDLMGEAINGTKSTKVNSVKWGNFEENYKSDVTRFMEDALNAAKNNIISSSNQEFVINEAGIRGKRKDDEGDFEDNQIWVSNNMIAFTDNNWATAKMALGHFVDTTTTPPMDTWGLVADTIVGKLVASNELLITNNNSTFSISGSQMSATNMSLSLTNSTNTININPEDGIEILKGATPVFSLDSSGNILIQSPDIVDPTWEALSESPLYTLPLDSPSGLYMTGKYVGFFDTVSNTWKSYMDNLGNFKLTGSGTNSLNWNAGTGILTINGGGTFSGALSAATGTFSGELSAATGTFSGDISAANGNFSGTISGSIDWSNITNAPATSFPNYFNGSSGLGYYGLGASGGASTGVWSFPGGTLGYRYGAVGNSSLYFTGGGSVEAAGNLYISGGGYTTISSGDDILQLSTNKKIYLNSATGVFLSTSTPGIYKNNSATWGNAIYSVSENDGRYLQIPTTVWSGNIRVYDTYSSPFGYRYISFVNGIAVSSYFG